MVNRIMPEIDAARCNLCGDCVEACPEGAASIEDGRVVLDPESCAYCGDCEELCPMGAIALPYDIVLADQMKESSDGEAPDRPD